MKFLATPALLAAVFAVGDAASPANATNSISRFFVEAAECSPVVLNVDLPGYDIGNSRDARFHFCFSLCSQDPRCTAWTWTDYEGGTCWYKSGHGNAVYNEHAVSYAEQSCATPYLVVENCDMRGNDRETRPGRSYSDCIGYGLPYPFTWSDYNGGTCWFKTTKSACEYAPNKFSGMLSDY